MPTTNLNGECKYSISKKVVFEYLLFHINGKERRFLDENAHTGISFDASKTNIFCIAPSMNLFCKHERAKATFLHADLTNFKELSANN